MKKIRAAKEKRGTPHHFPETQLETSTSDMNTCTIVRLGLSLKGTPFNVLTSGHKMTLLRCISTCQNLQNINTKKPAAG